MKQVLSVCLLLVVCGLANALFARPRPEIMGVKLGMSREDVRVRLLSLGTLEKEEPKRQEVWAVKDARILHLLIGYDADFRVRYVTAVARAGGPRIRYQDVGDLRSARRTNNQSNLKLTWEVPARQGRLAFVIIAGGRDPRYLESYSVKKLDQEEID
jgi:hypothetical protein